MLPRRRMTRIAIALATVLAAFVATSPGLVDAEETPEPTAWPATSGASPGLEGWPHALRLAGPTRTETGLAAALVLRGRGGYPFDDPSPDGDWWGLGTCPRSVIVVAGDNPADALAASSLSDPTGNSTEPYLERTAAADPLFDPVGGRARVDTDSAPILVTRSARQGATGLDVATRLAAADLRSGGCDDARQAIIVGGTAAVPAAVDAELLDIGYDEVFRIAGTSRYDTARLVAQSLGTAASPTTTCRDPLADDGSARMAWYANAAVEWRDDASSCRVMSRTVVLADGVVGADALAAGWWTGYWQVPLVLHDGSTTLPPETSLALQTLDVDHVIVLGGVGRIPTVVAEAAAAAAGDAEVIRLAGVDRYATSVEMAQHLGGWFPTGRGDEFSGSMVCIAASSGGGPGDPGLGWADALAAGPWCARANASSGAGVGAPSRALTPVTGATPVTTAAIRPAADPSLTSITVSAVGQPGHDAVPVLLVRAGSSVVPSSVADLLARAFHPADDWCSSLSAGSGCLAPGFAVVFGGSGIVTDAAVGEVSRLMGGGTTLGDEHLFPRLDEVFHTRLDMSPVFGDPAATRVPFSSTDRLCVTRDAYDQARWLVVDGADPGLGGLDVTGSARAEVMLDGRYGSDVDAAVRSPGIGAPVCVPIAVGAATSEVSMRAVGVSGRSTPAGPTTSVIPGVGSRFSVSNAFNAVNPSTGTGIASDVDLGNPGETSWAFRSTPPATIVVSQAETTSVTEASIFITLARGTDTASVRAPDTFEATFALITPLGTVVGTSTGEAILNGGVWRLRGVTRFSGGSWNVTEGLGGFYADITVNGAGFSDDTLSWRLDGIVE